jgi:hypothetical protein
MTTRWPLQWWSGSQPLSLQYAAWLLGSSANFLFHFRETTAAIRRENYSYTLSRTSLTCVIVAISFIYRPKCISDFVEFGIELYNLQWWSLEAPYRVQRLNTQPLLSVRLLTQSMTYLQRWFRQSTIDYTNVSSTLKRKETVQIKKRGGNMKLMEYSVLEYSHPCALDNLFATSEQTGSRSSAADIFERWPVWIFGGAPTIRAEVLQVLPQALLEKSVGILPLIRQKPLPSTFTTVQPFDLTHPS